MRPGAAYDRGRAGKEESPLAERQFASGVGGGDVLRSDAWLGDQELSVEELRKVRQFAPQGLTVGRRHFGGAFEPRAGALLALSDGRGYLRC